MSRPTRSWPRRALLATNVAMGVTLIAVAWSNAKATLQASATLARGHAELLAQAVERGLREAGPPPTADKLATILTANAAGGLRWVAVHGPDGRLLASTGAPAGLAPADLRGVGPGRLDTIGTRYRFETPLVRPPPAAPGPDPVRGRPGPGRGGLGPVPGRPPRPGPDDASGRPPRRPDGDGPGPPRGGPAGPSGGFLMLEFESAAVGDLVRGSRWSLAMGVAAALLLTAVALVLWRQELERERVQALLARQSRLSALGEMAAVMAHEIRNPLASLKGNAEVLAELAAAPATASEALARKAGWIVKEAARLSALLDDLLDFSRSGPLEMQPVEVADLLGAVVRELGDPRIDLDLEAAPERWSLDPVRIRQLLDNLLRNALAASPPDGRVELAAAADPGALTITVRDHGEGLPPGAESRIFEPFFTTRSQGTGLGLAVARRIAELHGGTLVARNHRGGGAELRLTLPAASTRAARTDGRDPA